MRERGMKPSRRTFLGAMAASPLAAKQAAGAAMSGKLGIRLPPRPPASPINSACDPGIVRRTRWSVFREMGIPDWQWEHWREVARERAHYLDHDIAALVSVSPSAKYTMQYQREMNRVEDRERNRDTFEELRDEWFTRHLWGDA